MSQITLQEGFGMKRGCPFGTIGNEITENDELIRQDLNLIFEVVGGKVATFFIKEKARGALAEDADPSQLADFCISLIQGAMLMGRIRRSSNSAKASVREALAHLKRYGVRSVRSHPTGGKS